MSIEEDSKFILYIIDINEKTSFYFSILALPIGFIFNLISILVFMRKQISKYNVGFYNICIALNNNIAIIIVFLIFFTQSKKNDILLWSNITYKSIAYGIRVTTTITSWFNVLIAFDIMLCIKYPSKYKSIHRRKVIYLEILATILGAMLIHSPNLLLNIVTIPTYHPITNQTIITKLCTYNEIVINVRDGVTIIIRIILPFLLMFVFNISIIKNLIRKKNSLNISRDFNREYNFGFSIIALSVLFIVTLLPNAISLVLLNVVQYGYKSQISSKNLAIINLCFNLSVLIASYNHAFPFLVNLKFNKLFRREFILFIKNKRSSPIQPSNISL